jgi:hypothetical protein
LKSFPVKQAFAVGRKFMKYTNNKLNVIHLFNIYFSIPKINQ